ncbi:PREDICTED: WD repeat domain-containing protein 83 [Bactrocera latifrons]|uniref:WD repeat domain-containing protein 83 n=1 Tax=Bactrocera latifrons TaxID=174628 RepID=A0A0K8W739_BACLA|nr:PREDICTED: WD repeat domain-containing protein 83 [Bactrocera latifrons]
MISTYKDFHRCKVIDCKQGAVRAVRYNVDGSYVLSCGSDKKIKLWNPKTGLLLKTYGGHADEVTDASGSCDSCYIVSSSLDKSIIYWDVSTGVPVRRLRGHAGGVRCVCFNEDSSIAISGGRDNAVFCWDIRTRRLEPVQVMKDARDCITTVQTNEHKIITSSLDGCIRQYDIRVGELVCDKIGEPITFLKLTRDEQCIVAACQDSTVRLIDCDTGSLLSEYKGHKAEDFHIECGIMANDAHIVSGTSEGCAVVWDLLDGKILQRIQLSENGGVVNSLNTHPKENEIVLTRRRDLYVYNTDVNEDDIDNATS